MSRKSESWGLPKCDETPRSLNFWRNSFMNCITDNKGGDLNKQWEELDASKKRELVKSSCCTQLSCSNPEVVVPRGVTCVMNEKPTGPRFGSLRGSRNKQGYWVGVF